MSTQGLCTPFPATVDAGPNVGKIIVNAVVVYLWNLFIHGEGAFNWDTTFFFAITFGFIVPLLEVWRPRKDANRGAES